MRTGKAIRCCALLAFVGAAPFLGCTSPSATSDAGADASTDAKAPVDEAKEREEALLRAELRRSAAEVTPTDQQNRSVSVRRSAARALARIGGDEARPGLLRALSDEDPEVVAWAAYGLGFSCKGHEKATVAALAARSLSFDVQASEEKAVDAGAASSGRLDPQTAMARAMGRCGAEESEATLVAWLSGSPARASAAALALGDLASTKERLREETLAALLNVAAGSASAPPAPEGLFAIGRLEHVPVTVMARLREVATARLGEPGELRLLAVRALGRAGSEAAPDLDRVLRSADVFSASERAEAARVLKRLGSSGQRILQAAIGSLVPASDAIGSTAMGDELGVLLAALGAVEAPGKATKELKALAALAPPPSAPAAVLRRLSWIRCTAAALVAGSDPRDRLLAACDLTTMTEQPANAADAGPGDAGTPDAGVKPPGQPGSIGARTIVHVLDRALIEGKNLALYKTYVNGGDLRARQAAVELLAKHEELSDEAKEILEAALAAPETGLVATAAGVIAGKPTLANEQDKPKKKKRKKPRDEEGQERSVKPAASIVKQLLAILGRADAENDIELTSSAMEALGALGIAEAKPRLEELCGSSWPEIRKRASKALGLLSNKAPTCAAPPGGGPLPAEATQPVTSEVTLTLDTDAGQMTLTLDGRIAPMAVTRIVELARAGYYDGMVVHRVVPGFVTQLGAPHGDGYGGPAGKPSLRCETSPIAFDTLSVGIALAGRDTGSSQFFVMHGRHPHLDGQYAWVGRATGSWASFVDGDLVRKITVSP
ncbi:MAG: peptidylprolyl isomerase [Polyangiaceae bacterium]|nr:peptidylprolyl isomerase [Polyangiaceae bacterium]